MKNIILALVACMTVSCVASIPDELLNEMIISALAEQEPLDEMRAPSTMHQQNSYDGILIRVNHQVTAYLNKFNVPFQTLPGALQQEVQHSAQQLSRQLAGSGAHHSAISNATIQKLVAGMLTHLFNPSVRYIKRQHIEKHLDTVIVDMQKKIGMGHDDVTPMLHRAMKVHKQKVHKAVVKRLTASKRSYTTDREISQVAEKSTQLLLKQMWLSTQMQAQKLTLAFLAEKHANSSLYVQPPAAQRLQKVANEIKKQIGQF